MDECVGLAGAELGLVHVEEPSNLQVRLNERLRVLDAHVANAGEHQVLGDLVAEAVDAQEEDARALETTLGLKAPQTDLTVVTLHVDLRRRINERRRRHHTRAPTS